MTWGQPGNCCQATRYPRGYANQRSRYSLMVNRLPACALARRRDRDLGRVWLRDSAACRRSARIPGISSADDTMQLSTAAVTLPAGWDVDIAAASQGRTGGDPGRRKDRRWSMPCGSASRASSSPTRPTWCTRNRPSCPTFRQDADGTDGEKWQILPGRRRSKQRSTRGGRAQAGHLRRARDRREVPRPMSPRRLTPSTPSSRPSRSTDSLPNVGANP